MNIENPIKLLRELKGAPLSVLFALAIVHQPVSAGWLEMVTGYSNPSITNALRLLIEFNYCLKISGQKWQIVNNIQLPLGENQKNLEISGSTATTTDIERTRNYEGKAAAVEKKIKNSLIFEMLEQVGVGEPVRSQLAKDEFITKEYLEFHIKKWMDEEKGIGLLIYRLRNHDPIPDDFIFRKMKYSI